MSTGPTTLPEKGAQARRAARRWFPRLRDAKIRSKLALILVVPVAAVLALATVRLVDVGRGALDASLIRDLTALSTDVSALTQDLHKERMAAAVYLADPPKQDPKVNYKDLYNQAVNVTDERVTAYTAERQAIGEVPASVEARLVRIDEHLATLNVTRQDMLARQQRSVAESVLRYGNILTDLVAYGEVVGQLAGEGDLAEELRAVAAFARAKAAKAEEEAVVYAALIGGEELGQEQLNSFLTTLTSQESAQAAFELVASSEQQAIADATVTGDAVNLAQSSEAQVSRTVGQEPEPGQALDAQRAIGAVVDLMRFAEVNLEQRALAEADDVRAAVFRQAIVESILVLITLFIAVALAVVLARSLNRSLRRLREGALAVANRDLPEAVAQLRDVRSIGEGGPDEIVRQVRDAIRLPNRDEVGQVAQAFNVVHREAVRIAAEQAALRTSVSAMFLNLARRSQALVDRMIGELDMIERGEEDPKRLAQLFQLDHLATRMRRNDENLLVLAGADSTAPRRDDALLVDALRAAQSEVELYNRIEFGTVDTDISIAAHAVNDVVRLVAELLDNATRFSPPNTVVVADARRIRDYVLIQIEDRGLGLTEDQLEALNHRLSQPPAVDVAAFRLMGLAVVGRLASRYGVRVELRPNVEGGTVAQVTLPSGIVVLPKPRTREQVLTRPRSPLAVETSPAAAAPVSGGWPQPAAPVTRSSAATLSEPWPSQAPASWDTSAVPVNATAATSAFPTLGHSAGATLGQPQSGLGSPTVAYPTVHSSSLPQRGQNAAIPATAHPMTPAVLPPSGLPAGPVAGSPGVSPRPDDGGEVPIYREMEAVWFRSHGQASTQIFSAVSPSGVPASPAPAPAAPTGSYASSSAPAASAGLSGGASGFSSSSGLSGGPSLGNGGMGGGSGLGNGGSGLGGGGMGGGGMGGGSGLGNGGMGGGSGLGGSLPSRAPTPPPAAPPPAAYAPPVVPPAVPQDAGAGAVPRPRSAAEDSWRTAADEGWRRAEQASEPSNAGTTRSGLPKRVPQAQLVPGGVETSTNRERTRRTPDEVRGLLSAYHRGVQRGRSAGIQENGSTSTKETS
ncbi:sensor histidine kinase [Phytohabitans suffuscus]|uniref:histidine kinase n=1 Tax=Phytohabitans suffuscus TaxID=624315 RepID=A0A6F8YL31_9ACTN|nr:nitrate- and nitrite sensing domain-containing protein [Phytohabitans suffuscus]BCB86776.1 histidine kinase [Phytohabitans suffuscus]